MDNNLNYKNYEKNTETQDILLSVIVPCFNEINTLGKVIDKIKKYGRFIISWSRSSKGWHAR